MENRHIDNVRKYPNEITLVAIGPLTNIATALTRAPDIASKIRAINIMEG
jgi:purine nucleosidase